MTSPASAPDFGPALRCLSLGAGIQSSTVLLLACEGVIPGFDVALFADTGWEPRAVYENLARLRAHAAKFGIPVRTVSAGNTAEVEQIVRSLAARGYRLHAFGAKVLGLGRYADAISSSDSAAWSFRGRYVPGCSPSHRSESNCVRFALAWHTRLRTSLRAGELGHKPGCEPTSPRSTGSRARGQKNGRTRPGSPRPRQAHGRMAARAQNSPAA
jgi:hypothetical protein